MSLDAALEAAKRGWHVFPVDHPDLPQCAGVGVGHNQATCTERGKHPAVKWGTWATTDPKVIAAEWSGRTRNVGIHAGKSGLVIVDEDKPEALQKYAADTGREIPETFTVRTGKGRHYYFTAPARWDWNTKAGALQAYGMDLRSGNGYVVASGCTHASGAVYTAENDRPPAPLPTWLNDAITGAVFATVSPPFELPERITAGRADGTLGREETLFKYACSLRAKGTPIGEALVAMRAAWARCEQPPGDLFTLQQAIGKLDQAWNNYETGGDPRVSTTARPSLADRAFSRAQLKALPQPRPLIADTLDRRTVAVLAGARGSLKTFVLVSWFCSVATGTRWLGRIAQQGRVLLVAAEGADGMDQRIAAWETEHGPVPDDQLTVISGPVNMLDRGQVAELAQLARGHILVGLDTLARCAVGGDENSAKDMGLFVDACYQLRDATEDGTVAVAHHMPKGSTTTLRGSSAIEGGVDTIYLAEGGPGGMTLKRDKRKEGPTEDTIQTRLQLAGMSGFLCGQDHDLTNAADKLMSVYLSAFSNTGATKAELRTAAEMPSATFHRSLNSLIKLGLLRNTRTPGRPFYVGKETSTP